VIARLVFVSARLAAAGIFLLTWAYGVTTQSAFAFDMFVKPQVAPALTAFVSAHAAWLLLGYALSAATLVPLLMRRERNRRARLARWAAVAYLAGIGAIVAWLTGEPYLASLASGSRHPGVVPGALVPLVWLAAIDHLAAPRAARDASIAAAPLSQRRLLLGTLLAPVILWAAHLGHDLGNSPAAASADWWAGALWALLLNLVAFQAIYLALCVAAALSVARPRLGYAAAVAMAAAGLAAFVHAAVLPPLSIPLSEGLLVAAPFGAAIALIISGLRAAGGVRPSLDGMTGFLAPRSRRPIAGAAIVIATIAAAARLSDVAERTDWAYILQQTIAIAEAAIVTAACLRLAPLAVSTPSWSWAAVGLPPLIAMAALFGALRGSPAAAVDQAIAVDPLARTVSRAIVRREAFDVGFYRRILDGELSNWSARPDVPPMDPLPAAAADAARPHVFVIVLDSLRRDYLSTYNPAVTFTPSIGRWAQDSFVFRNAFTPYGGTILALPSLWAGQLVPRGVMPVLKDINRLEQLIVGSGYDFLINDHTVETSLRPDTRRTFIDPYVASVNTDLCQNIDSLGRHLGRRATAQPLFAFLAPMNLHVVNTLTGDAASRRDPVTGLYAPVARRLERVDACFGRFIDLLKAAGIHDDSVIVLTSDHGDSLGEDDRWGHQTYLFPEILRIPLIIHVPPPLRARLTTDVGRVAFLHDLQPTLQHLMLGAAPVAREPPHGSSLFAGSGGGLPSRRRQSFLLMSSYGPSYGVVRRNGREMYTAEFDEWRDYAFRLGPLTHERIVLTDARRRVSQAALAREVDAFERLYRRADR
jgi:hypothetical protein